MAHRRKNLLDAFRATGSSAPPAPLATPARPAPAARVGARAPRAGSEPVPESRTPARGVTDRSTSRPLWLGMVGAAILALLIVWIVKSRADSDAPTLAREPAPNLSSEAPRTPGSASADAPRASPTPAASLPATGATDQDRAFQDKANKFTVRLAQYDNDAAGLEFAREAYRYLQVEGVPVVQPIVSGDQRHIFVCAGAESSMDGLAVIVDFVKRLRGPGAKSKRPPFEGAYIDNIDHVLKRP